MPFRIVPIVEGHGEVEAVGVLFRRLTAEMDLAIPIDIARPIRRPRGSLMKSGGLEAAISLAAIEMGESGAIFVLLDSEGECPAEVGPRLLARARSARTDKQISLVLAHHEFEAWFLASASSLKGCSGLSGSIEDHATPEDIQDCKGWLRHWKALTSKYEEPVDQPSLAAAFNLEIARRRAPSFDKLYREFEAICRQAG
jgi:Domain of unknown function (DUF4276)